MRRRRRTSHHWGAGLLAAAAAGALLIPAIRRSRRHYDFGQRVAIITGGSRGLGLLIARELAKEGARLCLLARDLDEIRRAADELSEAGADVLGIRCDISDKAQVDDAIKRAHLRFGRIDILINNAGIMQVGPLDSMTLEDFQQAMAVHFWGSLYCTLGVLPHMRRVGGGRIVNIASIGGLIGVPHMAPYCASKFAHVGLSEALRAELTRERILVTTVCPAPMRTGSYVNAVFKGRQHEEFTWFALNASLPLASINAQRAARRIISACRAGQARLMVPAYARLAPIVNATMPSVGSAIMRLMNWMLPSSADSSGTEARRGRELHSRWAPSRLTQLSERAAKQNNESPNPG
jgi:NAD(P)-dependent dehydrogenase (short-subunit alcohol dehydrogenase family)